MQSLSASTTPPTPAPHAFADVEDPALAKPCTCSSFRKCSGCDALDAVERAEQHAADAPVVSCVECSCHGRHVVIHNVLPQALRLSPAQAEELGALGSQLHAAARKARLPRNPHGQEVA